MNHDHPRRFSPAQAHRLDAPERKVWLPIEPVLEAMELAPGMMVADIGAGTGYFALPVAQAVGETGHVVAVDVAPEMLALLRQKVTAARISNLDFVQAESASTGLDAGSVDRVLLANIWHEVDDRAATLAEVARVLRAEGRVVILDWSPDIPEDEAPLPGPPLEHRIALSTVQQELVDHGWRITLTGRTGQYSWLAIATYR